MKSDRMSSFVGACQARFASAVTRAGCLVRDFRIAGRRIRICFAGDRLVHLRRPLAHLAIDPANVTRDPPDLEIMVWDSTAGDHFPPAPPWKSGHIRRGEILGWDSGHVRVNFDSEHYVLNLFDSETGRALYWVRDVNDFPFWEIASPFRNIFHWWSTEFGAQLTHAAAVGLDGEGVLLTGRGGSGKSTTTMACLEHGLNTAGDDYVLLAADPEPVAYSLYSTTKMHTSFLKQTWPHWVPHVADHVGPERKSVFLLHEAVPRQISSRLRIRAILTPHVSNSARASLERISPAAAVMAAAPSTMFQLPEAREHTLRFLTQFARSLAGYRLHLARDLHSAPACIRDFLRYESNKELLHAA